MSVVHSSAVLARRSLPIGLAIVLLACSNCTAPQKTNTDAPGGTGLSRAADLPKPAAPAEPRPVVKWSKATDAAWSQVDTLESEQKYEAAYKIVEEILARATADKSSADHVKALIQQVQLRTALHGYETAVKLLRAAEWPEDLLGHSVMQLYYAHALVTYANSYSWEVRKREKVDTKGEVDLKRWTWEQLVEEAQRAYHEVWQQRDGLGAFPVGALSEYVNPNNYPEGIRSTLRDATAYLWTQMIVNRSYWRPEDANQIHQLDLAQLIAGEGGVSVVHPTVHPLRRAAAILGDLERWHAGKGSKAAALEARLTRLRMLHAAFTDDADRTRIKDDVRAALEPVRGLAWWAMGMYELATWTHAESAAESVVRAREIAIACRDAYPQSVGGQRCRHFVASVEAPTIQLKAMSHDAPGKASVGLTCKNLETAWFRAYRFDLVENIESARDYDLFRGHGQLAEQLRGRTPVAEWKVDLARTTDFKPHKHFVVPPMQEPGYYVVVASAREHFGKSNNSLAAAHMILTDLALVTRPDGTSFEAFVLSGAKGDPVKGAKVHVYRYDWRKSHKRVGTKTTDANGRVSLKYAIGSSYFLVVEHGEQWALDPSWMSFSRPSKQARQFRTMVYTDRSVYRPMQTLHVKVVAYEGTPGDGAWEVSGGMPVTVHLRDPNHEIVETLQLKTGELGTASGELNLPKGRLLGRWRLDVAPTGSSTILVEEYKRPTFEARLLEPDDALRLNRPATVEGEARYYFGLPVTGGKAAWRVTRTAVHPWWWSYWYWWRPAPSGGPQHVASGTTPLGDDGKFAVAFQPEADERLAGDASGVSYNYRVQVDVTDEGGESRSASRSFRLGFVAVKADIGADVGFFTEGAAGALNVRRTDLDGTPAAGKGSWSVVALKAPGPAVPPASIPRPGPPPGDGALRTEGDGQRPRWQPAYDVRQTLRMWGDGKQVAKGNTSHGDDGAAEVRLPKLKAGAYRLKFETDDKYGATYRTTHDFIVAGDTPDVPLPAVLLVERSSVTVDGKARVFAHSGLAGQTLYLDIYRAGRSRERRRLAAGQGGAIIELPVLEEDRGGFSVSLHAVADHQFVQLTQTVMVPWDNKELKIELATFRDTLRPGQKETWTVKVSAPEGGPEPAAAAIELLAYMYDRSLDIFAPHHPPSALNLYPGRTGIPWARSTLGAARVFRLPSSGFGALPGFPGLSGDTLRFYSRYGIGGPGRRGQLRATGGARSRPTKMMARKGAAKPAAPPSESPSPEPMDATAELERSDDKGVADESPASAAERGEDGPAPELRTNFSETAFWEPHILVDKDGTASITFEVPDSVTSWRFFIHGVTRDMGGGSLMKEVRTVKDLMVRPYLPRFVREGDRASLKVAVNNASDADFKGTVDFDIIDPATEASIAAELGLTPAQSKGIPFEAKAGGGTTLEFPITVPPRVGLIAFKVTARTEGLSDGELRPIPILPGRFHLAQSRFTTLKDKARKELHFADLKADDDPSRVDDQMVVTINGQLFYGVIAALPYLVEYPYQCTEQTMNRFLATGILSSLYEDYPAVAAMARRLSERETGTEAWDADDPNRKMGLEETPWLTTSRGGDASLDYVKVLDPRIAAATRRASLARLQKAQTSLGGFPWFSGGPPSPYITLYLLHGFSKAIEFGVDVPKPMVRKAWSYLHRHMVQEVIEWAISHDCCWEMITFVNYVLTNYPDESWTGGVFDDALRKRMLDFSFKHWKRHAPYLKGQLALTLHRRGRTADARLVWESVLDSARTTEDQGTFWAAEDRSWLWYNDTIETHAFALRTTMELKPKEGNLLDGLVLWLFINKKLNHWKSTKATAEVIYSLAHYLKSTASLGVREETRVQLGDLRKTFVFEPDAFEGKRQLVLPGKDIDPAKHSTVVIEKDTKGYQLASATWHFSTEKLPDEARGDFLGVQRSFYKRVKTGRQVTLQPLADGAKIAVGDEVEVQLSLTAKHALEYVHLRDPRGAGFEPTSQVSKHKWDLGIGWYEEIRDSGTNFFFERLPVGEYTFKYRIRATVAGTFKVSPATVQPMYAPEFSAYSSGKAIEITP